MSSLLVAFVASRIDWQSMSQRVRGGHLVYILLASLLVGAALAVGTLRWYLLLRAGRVALPLGQVFRIYFVSTFSGTFLPSTTGADFVRTFLVSRDREVLGRTAISVIVDRAAAFAGLIGLAWIGIIVEPRAVPGGSLTFLAWVTGVSCVLGGAAVAATAASTSMIVRLPRRLRHPMEMCRLQIRAYFRRPPLLLILSGASLIIQALIAVQLVLLGRAIDVHLSFSVAAVAVTLVTVATLLPVSIGGFGVREGTYAAVLSAVSVSATSATLISLLTVLTLFAASAPGALLLARGGLKPALSAPE